MDCFYRGGVGLAGSGVNGEDGTSFSGSKAEFMYAFPNDYRLISSGLKSGCL
jgi:hypothetical protein